MCESHRNTTDEQEASGDEFAVSQKVKLRLGDRVQASGGPFYQLHQPDGTLLRSRMRDSGPFTFIGWFRNEQGIYLQAYSNEGFTILNLGTTYRHPDLPSYIKAPYRRIRKVGLTKRQRSEQQTKKTHKPKSGRNKPTLKQRYTRPALGQRDDKARTILTRTTPTL
jgi:hypothetical protein